MKPFDRIVIGLLIILMMLIVGLTFVLKECQEPTRAITAAEHDACAALPHGSQVMENKRKECFHALYRAKPFSASQKSVD